MGVDDAESGGNAEEEGDAQGSGSGGDRADERRCRMTVRRGRDDGVTAGAPVACRRELWRRRRGR